jgi:hypothetical protein
MKKLLFKLSLIASISYYCIVSYSQVQFNNTDSVINFLEGNWFWISSCGGFKSTSMCYDPNSLGYTKRYVFSKISGCPDSIYYIYYKDQVLIKSGKTKISYSSTNEQWNLDSIAGFITPAQYLRAYSEDTIALGDHCIDCFTNTLVRRANSNSVSNEQTVASIVIFPNPCKSNLYIDMRGNSHIEKLTVHDLTGRIIKDLRDISDPIDISVLSKGIYLITVKIGEEIFNVKIIKE